MICEDLDAGADDERHEENVQEVLHAQPCREAGSDSRHGWRCAGISHQELLHCRQLPQGLSNSHTDNEEHKTEREGPQYVDPTLANPDLGYDANLRWQPVVQENAVVRVAEFG